MARMQPLHSCQKQINFPGLVYEITFVLEELVLFASDIDSIRTVLAQFNELAIRTLISLQHLGI